MSDGGALNGVWIKIRAPGKVPIAGYTIAGLRCERAKNRGQRLLNTNTCASVRLRVSAFIWKESCRGIRESLVKIAADLSAARAMNHDQGHYLRPINVSANCEEPVRENLIYGIIFESEKKHTFSNYQGIDLALPASNTSFS